MAVHAGNSLYGKIDQVPGLFHVATEFFHVNFVPLLPTTTYLVLDGSGEPVKYRIAFSFKSVVFTWVRLALLLGALFAGGMACVVAFVRLMDGVAVLDWRDTIGLALTALGCWYFLYKSYQVTRASPERAVELAQRAGISLERLARHYPSDLAVIAAGEASLTRI